jgi:hypothetical protein
VAGSAGSGIKPVASHHREKSRQSA